ncbi:radical SAM/SPASM domain-containing protein [Planctomycetota bacterium]
MNKPQPREMVATASPEPGPSTPFDLLLQGVRSESDAFVGPEQAVVDPTNRCNNNCIGCWTNSPLLLDKAPPQQWFEQALPTKVAIQLIRDLSALQTERIRFSGGGEPFCHPDMMELLKEAKQEGLICSVTTNFTLVSEEVLDELLAIEIDELTVSLWAATPTTYSRVHPNKTPRTFERITDRLLRLSQAKSSHPKVTLAHVVCGLNFGEVLQMYDYARHVGAEGLYYTVLDPVAGRTDGLLLRPEHQDQVLSQIGAVKERRKSEGPDAIRIDNFHGFVRRVEKNDPVRGFYDLPVIDEIPCYVGWIFCRILPNGDVSPCCRGVQIPLGNLHRDSFRQIWHSHAYQEFRRSALKLSKSDPYFHPIECQRTCDNYMHNEDLHRRLIAAGCLVPSPSSRLTTARA